MHKLFINEFNFNADEYEEFISVSDEESKKILENKIIESLENLDKLPKKVKDFDKKTFKNDLLVFLYEYSKGLWFIYTNNTFDILIILSIFK